jgi:hypothetical protein
MDSKNIGAAFQEATKHRRDMLEARELDWENKPPTYKTYSQAETVILPPPSKQTSTIDAVLRGRRSVRAFSEESNP